ncbi:GNAT family N-acetyltransferase [Tenuibacillus multivorans]|uniref:L-amino acid N-acyltransferase YncA n=1 Tax=Tenuibacillus multivorans TaxID=237069 RepID=A0A1H0EXS3_9BACI|nr:GNAT family N-acetyltransferase [Tenuibacillus multivorans]GEL76916.1 N-acetyltransferase [Tenuibacillus multivorans]SDN87089.1 L-amino acid N-acyltransferase YncA [Tenuibacillus multivorans]
MLFIREATRDDAEQIANIHDQTWRLTYESLIDDEDLKQVMTLDHRRVMWETMLSSNKVNQYVFVAEEDDGKLVGFISGGLERTKNFDYEVEIYDIYVLKEYQKQSVGQRLLEEFVRQCLKDGYKSLLVWILTNNPYGQFYVRFGAQKVEAENVTIGHGTYEETAYGWSNIQTLADQLMELPK